MKIFLDANILVTIFNKEYPLYNYAARILSLAGRSEFTIYTSPLCLGIVFYFASKKCGEALARKKIKTLINQISITSMDANTCQEAASNPRIHDFEDGLQYYSAKAMACDLIITTNVEDFYFGDIGICTCEEFVSQYF